MSDFRQCEAIKPNGERCKRQARQGSAFCYSHRNQARNTMRPKDKIVDLDLWIPHEAVMTKCDICGHLRRPVRMMAFGSEAVVVCSKCFALVHRIKAHIGDFRNVEKGRMPREIYDEMEKYGIPEDLTERIRLWMLSIGELVIRGPREATE